MYSSEELKIILPLGHLYKGTSRWVLFWTLKANRSDTPLIAYCLGKKSMAMAPSQGHADLHCDNSQIWSFSTRQKNSLCLLSKNFLCRATTGYSRVATKKGLQWISLHFNCEAAASFHTRVSDEQKLKKCWNIGWKLLMTLGNESCRVRKLWFTVQSSTSSCLLCNPFYGVKNTFPRGLFWRWNIKHWSIVSAHQMVVMMTFGLCGYL